MPWCHYCLHIFFYIDYCLVDPLGFVLTVHSNKWYKSQIHRRSSWKDRTGVSKEGHGTRWSMAVINDSIDGVGNFEREAWTIQWAAINKDHSRYGDRVDSS
jgi:hypothetical protein